MSKKNPPDKGRAIAESMPNMHIGKYADVMQRDNMAERKNPEEKKD